MVEYNNSQETVAQRALSLRSIVATDMRLLFVTAHREYDEFIAVQVA